MKVSKFFIVLKIFLYFTTSVFGQGCPTTYSNTAIRANVLSTTTGTADSCCSACQQNAACAAYKWNSTGGGTCYLLDDSQPLYASNGEAVGVTTPPASKAYALAKSYDSSNWLDTATWRYATNTGAFVQYVDANTASSKGLVKTVNGKIYVGMDNTTVLPWNETVKGRDGIYVQSISAYTQGLFILNLDHMPVGPGVLVEWWMTGPNWPNEGEIDIVKGTFNQGYNSMSLHTIDGCTMQDTDDMYFTGKWEVNNGHKTSNCYENAPGQYPYVGCAVDAPNNTLGAGFNQAGGGVFAIEWDNQKFIRIWNFLQPNIPADINSASPNPATWGMPMAYYTIGPNCTTSHFENQQLILMVDLCPSWASYPGGTCECHNAAMFAPELYSDAYWLINSLKVFCKSGQTCIAS